MSVKNRLSQIKAQSQKVVAIPGVKHGYGMRSITDEAVNYQTRNTRLENDSFEDVKFAVVQCKCQKVDSSSMTGMSDCKGNSNGTVCRHSLAALMFASQKAKKSFHPFDNFSDAVRYANFGGKLIKITSHQGEGYCWGVVR